MHQSSRNDISVNNKVKTMFICPPRAHISRHSLRWRTISATRSGKLAAFLSKRHVRVPRPDCGCPGKIMTNNQHSLRLSSDIFKLKTYEIADSVEFNYTSTSLLAVHQSGEATFVQTNTSSSSSTRIDKLLAILEVPRHPSQAPR